MVDLGETVMVTGAAELGSLLEVVPAELTESVFVVDTVVVVDKILVVTGEFVLL